MLKAVIFDFDYTLGDSTDGIVLSANYALKTMGLVEKERDEIKKTIGLSLTNTYPALTTRESKDEAEQFKKLFMEKADEVMADSTTLYDGVKDILKKLKEKGYKLGIVTTKYRHRIKQILNNFDAADLIDLIVGGDDVKIEKPDPEGLLWAVESLNLEKSEVLYVGDSIVDAKTAQNAQVMFAAVMTGTTSELDFEPYRCAYIGQNIKDIYSFIVGRE